VSSSWDGRRKRERDLVLPDPSDIVCANCDRRVTEIEAIEQRWRFWSDGIGELHPVCPACAEREFGHRP
jgi:hypothetical protein